MHRITKLSFLTLIMLPQLGYSGPCYTDTGDCPSGQQVITVKSKQQGDNFCTEYINDKNEKTSKCYYHPVVKKLIDTTKQAKNLTSTNISSSNTQPKTEINYIYNIHQAPEPNNWENNNSPHINKDYNDYFTSNYFYHHNNSYNDYYHRYPRFPFPPRPPRPNSGIILQPQGITTTISNGKGHKNITITPIRERPHQIWTNFPGRHPTGIQGGFYPHGGGNPHNGFYPHNGFNPQGGHGNHIPSHNQGTGRVIIIK